MVGAFHSWERTRWLLTLPVFVGAFLLASSPVSRAPLPAGKAPLEVLLEDLSAPTGITVAPGGALFFTDNKEGRLFQRDPDGTVSLLQEGLRRPRGVVRSGDGTLFLVADGLQRHGAPSGLLLKRSANGNLMVLASGFRMPQQVALEPLAGDLVLTARGDEDDEEDEEDEEEQEQEDDPQLEREDHERAFPGTVFRLNLGGQIVRSHSGFLLPSGLQSLKDGSLLVAAQSFRLSRPPVTGSLFRIGLSGEIAVFLSHRFRGPTGLALDELGHVFLGARGERRPHSDGLIVKVARDGSFSRFASGFQHPWGLALDDEGNLNVTDPKAGRIYRFLAPDPPVLERLPAATKLLRITLSGTTEPEALVTVSGGQETVSGLSDSAGDFRLEVPLDRDQSHTLEVRVTGARGEGLTGAASTASILQDSTAPTVEFIHPLEGDRVTGVVSVQLAAEDTLSGLAEVQLLVDGQLQGSREEAPFTFSLDTGNFAAGPHILTGRGRDRAGNEAESSINVEFGLLPPNLNRFEPTSGKVGTPVTLSGENFDLNASGNQVSFNGVTAFVLASNRSQIFTRVPEAATTGPITVTTAGGTASSPGHFVVLPSHDFTLKVAPSEARVIRGGQVSFAVAVGGVEGFTGLVGLGAGGLPPTVAASFFPAQLAPGATGTLTLTASPDAAPGSFAFTVTGSSMVDGELVGHQQGASLTILPGGLTALAGRILDTDGLPVEGVTLSLGGRSTRTDAAGNFLLEDVPAGLDQFLFIDGSTAVPDRKYPTFPVLMTLDPGKLNTLPFTPFLHRQKDSNFVTITPGQNTVATDPDIPNFEMRIPAGVSIIGWDGQVNTKVSVRTVPLDRLPLPHPDPPIAARSVYMFYFDKVGGGTPTQPVPVTAANDLGLLPKEKADLWYYDEGPTPTSATNRWRKAGTATASPDGKTISTDPGVGLPRFCCGAFCFAATTTPSPSSQSPPPGGTQGGDPVDLATGLLILEKTDLILPGRLPLILTRTYRTNETTAGPFGIGTSAFFTEVLLAPTPESLIYVQPANTRVPFARTPDGSFINETFPEFRGAKILVNPDGTRTLRFKDGSTRVFEPTTVESFQLKAIADRNGNTIRIERDGIGRPVRLIEPAGRRLELTFAGVQVESVRDPIGREVRYRYDSGRLESVIDPAGGETHYTYDTGGRLATITDPRGITFLRNEYGASGRVLKQIQADEGEWRFAYMLSGARVTGPGCPGPTCPEVESLENIQRGFSFSGGFVVATSVTDPRGNTTRYRFNNFGLLIERIDALGQSTKFDRAEGTNLLLSFTDPLGREARFTYDASGNVTSITDPANQVRTFTYEPTFNRLTSIVEPDGSTLTLEYDRLTGDLRRVTNALGNVTHFVLDSFGKVTAITDALGNVRRFKYDSVGNLIAAIDPMGTVTRRTYDTASRLITVIDPRGSQTGFIYDDLNHVAQVTNAHNGTHTFAYDGNGNLLESTDARGDTTHYTYDRMDRLATRTDHLDRTESYVFDRNGNLTQFIDRKGQATSFGYDAANRRIRSQFADGTFAEFTYDAVGRLIHARDSEAGDILEEYDVMDRLLQETTPEGSIVYSHNRLGRRIMMTVEGESPILYAYDASGRSTQVMRESQKVSIGYDLIGRRALLTLPNGISTEYLYDAASRLTHLIYMQVGGFLGELTYEYDVAGNRVSVGGSFARVLFPDPVGGALYDAGNQQVRFGERSMTYDANGNMTSMTSAEGTSTFRWDARNRLVEFDGTSGRAVFRYDVFGRRVEKSTSTTVTEYRYDGVDVVKELSNGVGTVYLRSLSIDEPLIAIRNGVSLHYLADALGSTIALVDDAGTVQTAYSYEPFGVTRRHGESSPNPFQFTGRENDGTGLYYYRGRFHSPLAHRFISQDPLRRDPNPYPYADNNPVLLLDPYGLNPMATALGGAEIGSLAGPVGTVVGAVVGITLGAVISDLLIDAILKATIDDVEFPDPTNPPEHWIPKGDKPDTWVDPTTGEVWRWHPDATGDHGGDHWDIGGPRGPGGQKGKQDWWPKGGTRGPKPPGKERGLLPPELGGRKR